MTIETIENAWHWLTSTRYTRLLEARVASLEIENRALRNSIYARAGMAPVDYTQPDGVAPPHKMPPPIRRVVSWAQMKQKLEQEAARHAQSGRGAAAERSGNHA
jgi:hypothetical protein